MDRTEASASTPLLTAREQEPALPQRPLTTGPVGLGDSTATKALVLIATNVLLILKVFSCPELIFVLVIMQPIFCMLFIKFTVFSESELDEPVVPEAFSEGNVGLQAFEDLPRRMLELAELSMPSWGWWGRVAWWKFGAASAILLASLALLYVCVLDPGLMMLFFIVQPLLILFGFKWLIEYDAVPLQVIKLERVAFDVAHVSAADLPRSCAICLADFDDPETENHVESAQASGAEQNLVLVEGVGASGWRSSELVRLQCDPAHCFHAGCIQSWLATNSTCPLCRMTSGEQLAWWRRLYQSCTESSIIASTGGFLV